ncbi:MAG TPA: hypothetical protein VFE96_09845 [Candidatus Bathyarchaeia archaeon]|nr:hypothetical protein [Candidatus Bathyarchaeia archaeon]
MTSKAFRLFLLLSFLIALLVAPPLELGHSLATIPQATYATAGPSIPLWSSQRISDSSFETGLAPWTERDYNNFTRGLQTVQILHPGYTDNSAVQLMVNSGNLTTDSRVTLLQDFARNPAALGNGLTLRASVQTETIQGKTATDRVEISVTLVTAVGNITRIHYVFASGASLPNNATNDAYFNPSGINANGWTVINRNVATDAASAFPSLASSFTSATDIRLSVYSTSQSTPSYDPRIKYVETGGDSFWNSTEDVIYHPGPGSTFNKATDMALLNVTGTRLQDGVTPLSNDPWIKFIDTNLNGQWDPGEAVVYDWHHDGVYSSSAIPSDPVICGAPPNCGYPVTGSLLQDPVRQMTKALFDQIELYSTSGNYNSVLNGGFETGTLANWGNTAGFTIATSPVHSGSYSSFAAASGTMIDLAQSIDGRPVIDSNARLQAAAYIASMTGGSSSDKVDLWLGLVDSSPNANPLSIYYYFKTGTGSLPANTTDTLNHRVPGFGPLIQWLSLNQSLLPETAYFNTTGHTAPYRIETVVLEVAAQTSATTTAYFDDIAIPVLIATSPVASTYHAAAGLNSTYAYTPTKVPQGQFYLTLPIGQTILNVTSPTGTLVPQSGYTTMVIGGSLLITIANDTSYNYPTFSTWRIYTTSKNSLATLYATSSGSNTAVTAYEPGSSVTVVSKTRDPFGSPLSGSNVTILFYSSNTQAFTGKTNSQGWYNQTGLVLPQNSGTNTVEEISVSSSYIGLGLIQLTVNSSFPWAIIIYSTIAIAALVIFGLFYLRTKRKHKPQGAIPSKPQSAKRQ